MCRKDLIMSIKLLGAVFIIVGCGAFGFMVAATHRKESASLRSFLVALDVMECELQYQLTPLPTLCQHAGESVNNCVRSMLLALSAELEAQVSQDVDKCVQAVLCQVRDVPKLTAKAFAFMGQSLGKFDLDGQLKGIAMVRQECSRMLEEHTSNQDNRLRCYQTLGICAGAAMAILFV